MENPPAWQHVQIIGGVDAVLQPNTRRVIRITHQESGVPHSGQAPCG